MGLEFFSIHPHPIIIELGVNAFLVYKVLHDIKARTYKLNYMCIGPISLFSSANTLKND